MPLHFVSLIFSQSKKCHFDNYFFIFIDFFTIVISISALNAQLNDLNVESWILECGRLKPLKLWSKLWSLGDTALESITKSIACLKIYYLKKCYKTFPCIYIDFYHNLCNVYRFKIQEY